MKDSAITPNARAVHESRIVARVRWLVPTGQLEGTKNTIKTIEQTAYGYPVSAVLRLPGGGDAARTAVGQVRGGGIVPALRGLR